MKYSFSLIIGALILTIYMLFTNQSPADAVGLNRFEQAANLFEQ